MPKQRKPKSSRRRQQGQKGTKGVNTDSKTVSTPAGASRQAKSSVPNGRPRRGRGKPHIKASLTSTATSSGQGFKPKGGRTPSEQEKPRTKGSNLQRAKTEKLNPTLVLVVIGEFARIVADIYFPHLTTLPDLPKLVVEHDDADAPQIMGVGRCSLTVPIHFPARAGAEGQRDLIRRIDEALAKGRIRFSARVALYTGKMTKQETKELEKHYDVYSTEILSADHDHSYDGAIKRGWTKKQMSKAVHYKERTLIIDVGSDLRAMRSAKAVEAKNPNVRFHFLRPIIGPGDAHLDHRDKEDESYFDMRVCQHQLEDINLTPERSAWVLSPRGFRQAGRGNTACRCWDRPLTRGPFAKEWLLPKRVMLTACHTSYYYSVEVALAAMAVVREWYCLDPRCVKYLGLFHENWQVSGKQSENSGVTARVGDKIHQAGTADRETYVATAGINEQWSKHSIAKIQRIRAFYSSTLFEKYNNSAMSLLTFHTKASYTGTLKINEHSGSTMETGVELLRGDSPDWVNSLKLSKSRTDQEVIVLTQDFCWESYSWESLRPVVCYFEAGKLKDAWQTFKMHNPSSNAQPADIYRALAKFYATPVEENHWYGGLTLRRTVGYSDRGKPFEHVVAQSILAVDPGVEIPDCHKIEFTRAKQPLSRTRILFLGTAVGLRPHRILPYLFTGCGWNERLALLGRHIAHDTSRREVNPWPRAYDDLQIPLPEFGIVPVEWEEFLDRYDSSKRKKYERASKHRLALRDKLPESSFNRKSFVKKELYFEHIKPSNKRMPRLIQGVADYITIRLGPWMLSCTSYLKKVFKPGGRLVYLSGYSALTMGLIFATYLWRWRDKTLVYIFSDGHSFDAHYNADACDSENEMYRRLGEVGKHKRAFRRISQILQNQVECDGYTTHDVKYRTMGTRKSGDCNTSTGNTISNLAMLNTLYKDEFSDFAVLANGDDSITIAVYENQNMEAFQARALAKGFTFGQDLDMNYSFDLGLSETFCSGHFWPCTIAEKHLGAVDNEISSLEVAERIDYGFGFEMRNAARNGAYVHGPSINRYLSKFGYKYGTRMEPELYLRSCVLSVQPGLSAIPVLRDLATYVLWHTSSISDADALELAEDRNRYKVTEGSQVAGVDLAANDMLSPRNDGSALVSAVSGWSFDDYLDDPDGCILWGSGAGYDHGERKVVMPEPINREVITLIGDLLTRVESAETLIAQATLDHPAESGEVKSG